MYFRSKRAIFTSVNTYIPESVSSELKWQYGKFSKDSDKWFSTVKVINFDIINHECRGDPLEGSY